MTEKLGGQPRDCMEATYSPPFSFLKAETFAHSLNLLLIRILCLYFRSFERRQEFLAGPSVESDILLVVI